MDRKQKDKSALELLRIEYSTVAPVAEQLSLELTRQINYLLDREGITLGFPIEYRVKKWDSLSAKIDR